MDYTFKAERKMVPKWSIILCRVAEKLANSYRLENREGKPVDGLISSRCLQQFVPRTGTKLAEEQRKHEENIRKEEETEKLRKEQEERKEGEEWINKEIMMGKTGPKDTIEINK